MDISPDRGATWVQADVVKADDAPPQQHYSWMLWAVKIPVEKGQKEVGSVLSITLYLVNSFLTFLML